MSESVRRSAINISELGLYSDRSDSYYKNHRYSLIVKKFVIGVMVIIAALLVSCSVTKAFGKFYYNQVTFECK